MELRREVGTVKADRPHQFEGARSTCSACGNVLLDAKHAEWARVQEASRESAMVSRGYLRREQG